LKVVLSVEALAPVLSGIGRYTWELATRLPAQLGQGQISYMRQRHRVGNPAQLLDGSWKAPKTGLNLCGIKVKTPRWLKERQLIASCKGQVFHGPNFFLPSFADRGVITVHDLSVFKYPETHPIERIRHFEAEFTKSVQRASHIITDSDATRAEVIAYLGWSPDNITAVPLGVSPTFKPRSAQDVAECMARYKLIYGQYALCVSTMEPRKKIDALLVAYQRLPDVVRQRHPLVLIGGAGWLSEKLHEEIARLSAQGWLHYLGFVPEVDLPFLYSGARTFVYPSIYEGFGLPVLEAMASGVPVVTSNRTSLPEITQGAALLVDPDDIVALTQALDVALGDESWRQPAQQRGLTVAMTYTWDKCIENTIEVYAKVSQ